MAGRITPELKDQILARIDIVEVVSARVPLRPSGQHFKACCPFHREKTPSFIVTPSRQSYHRFGCGAHGDAIGFLMEYDRLSFPEAMKELATQAGVSLPESSAADAAATPQVDLEPIYQILEQAAALFRQQLREDPKAVAYLKQRGLTGEVAADFGLGFAPPGWDFLLRRLGDTPARQQALIDAGLVIERTVEPANEPARLSGGEGEQRGQTRRYDRFRNRIIFPVRDYRGRVIAFGGRVLDGSEPKYLNSPETPVFHKGQEVYGLYEARQRERKLARLLIVEGYMDAIALAQYGLPYAVATLGTATTPEQLQRLKRQTAELVFCFDGDRAGLGAAWKALRVGLPLASERLTLRFLLLPPGQDPDSLLRAAGADAFRQRIDNALLLSDYLFKELGERFDLGSAEGRARCDAAARELIALAPEGTYRQLLLQRLEDVIGVRAAGKILDQDKGQAAWRARGAAAARAELSREARWGRQRLPRRARLTAAQLASALLLRDPQLGLVARTLPDQWTWLNEGGITLLGELLAHIEADPDLTTAMLLERYQGSEHEAIVAELADPNLTQHIPEEGMEPEFTGALATLSRQAAREHRFHLLSRGELSQIAALGNLNTRGGEGADPRTT
jgi:DNA primase